MSVSQSISLYNVFKLIERVTPKTILADSICIFSYCVQLSQTTDAYLSIGLKNDIYIFGSLFCDELNISALS